MAERRGFAVLLLGMLICVSGGIAVSEMTCGGGAASGCVMKNTDGVGIGVAGAPDDESPLADGYITGTVVGSYPYGDIAGAIVTNNETSTTATTNATGEFNMTTAPGTYNLTITASGYKTEYRNDVDVTSGNETLLFIVLEKPTGTLMGMVKDKSTGSPISVASVTPDGYLFGDLTTANGSYKITSMDVGTHVVNVTAFGYKNASQTINILADQVNILDFEMEKEDIYTKATVKGTITDAKSKSPIDGAIITIGAKTAYTDSTGAFEMLVEPGTYTVKISKSGYNEISEQKTFSVGYEYTLTAEMTTAGSGDTGGGGGINIMMSVIISVILIVVIAAVAAAIAMRKKKRQAPTSQPQYPQQYPQYPAQPYPAAPPQQYPQPPQYYQYPAQPPQQYPPAPP